MKNFEVYSVPLMRSFEELDQPVLPQHLPNVAPCKMSVDITRSDLEIQRIIFIVGSLGEFTIQQTRRRLLAHRCGSFCEDRQNSSGTRFPIADRHC